VADIVSSLVPKSIIAPVRRGAGGVRYRLLETIRDYGSMLPTSLEEDALLETHAAFYADAAARGETAWFNSVEGDPGAALGIRGYEDLKLDSIREYEARALAGIRSLTMYAP
jgi:predicted ATPase